MRSLHIARVASEIIPFAKTGGLADVCGSLPRCLAGMGHRCSLFMPAYGMVLRKGLPIEATEVGFTISMAGRQVACRLLKTRLPSSDVEVYLIDQPQYFERESLYGDRQGDYRDNSERFAFFCKSVVHAIEQLDLRIDIAHCHDWQAGLIPAYMATGFGQYGWPHRAASVMTIHNLAYQGRFWHYDMALTGLDWRYFNWREMEFYGDVSYLKTGIVFADKVTTVSPTYASEIRRPEHGCGLDGVLRDRGDDLIGIVNGVDYDQWSPATDAFLPKTYDASTWRDGKAACKAHLQSLFGLPIEPSTPLVGIIGRMASQKGWDLIIETLRQWLNNRDVQWVILGTGQREYQDELQNLAAHVPHRLGLRLEFSDALAHNIEAGADLFLMPSQYEPCGLNQLYSLRYGTVPVVHATGGLVDTVVDANTDAVRTGTASGFSFHEYSISAMEDALERALALYRTQSQTWGQVVKTGMQQDWSWGQSAAKYLAIYEDCLSKKKLS